MANVHGFNDIQQGPGSSDNFRRDQNFRRPNNQQQQRDMGLAGQNGMDNWNYTMENLRAVEQHRVLFICGNTKIKNPRQQNYMDMLKIACCPVIKLFSITILLLIAIIAMYITSLIMGLNKQGQLLQVRASTLVDLGGNIAPKVKAGQVYRLLAAQFLHVNFIHLVGNVLTLIIFVSRIQYTFGWWRTLIIYLISGIGGNIFTDLTNGSQDVVKVGASTCLYGIIGAIIGYIILNWRGLDLIGRLLKCQLIFSGTIIILFIFVLTPYGSNVDYMGHLGGFLIGLTACAIHPTILNERRQKIMRAISLFLCVGMLTLWFLLFYLR